MAEHMSHAGQENGNLQATYNQLADWGLTRSEISTAIEEAQFFGLVRRTHRGGIYQDQKMASTYRLTFLPCADTSHTGSAKPTNDWERRTEEQIQEWRKERSEIKKRKKERKTVRRKQFPGATSRTATVRLPELPKHKFARRKFQE